MSKSNSGGTTLSEHDSEPLEQCQLNLSENKGSRMTLVREERSSSAS